MKKAFKKIMTLALVLALVFSFSIKPKQAEAVGAELTLAAGVAAGFSLPVLLVGAAAAVAIGATIGTNWDVISAYGEEVWSDLTDKGIDPNTLVDTENKTVTMSPDMINSAARAVDVMPPTIFKAGAFVPIVSGVTVNFDTQIPITPINLAGKNGNVITFESTFRLNYLYFEAQYSLIGGAITGGTFGANYIGVVDGKYRYQYTLWDNSYELYPITKLKIANYNWNENIVPTISYAIGDLTNQGTTYDTSESFGMVADNVYQRELYANSMLASNQVMKLSDTMDLTNATLEDVLSVQNNTYDETRTQTGILSGIWQSIKGLPTSMAAAATSAATAINTKARDLWDDAGAIWSGMGDTLTNIQTDVNTNIGALVDSMAGGIDNIRTDIGAMMDNLRAGIDSLATSAAANMAAWGQLTLDGIDAGIGTISTGLTNIWERVGAIPGAIAAIPGDIVTGLTDLAIPTPAQIAENEENMQNTKQLFLSKFDFITVPIEQIKSLYAQRKSLHDLTVDIMGQTVYVLPIQFAGVVSGFRPIASGAAVVGTIIFIYRRVQPGDVI